MTTKSEWQEVNRALIAEAREKLGEPPTAEEMERFSKGELSADEANRIRELLIAYPELARGYYEPFVLEEEPEPARVVSFRRYVPTTIAAALALLFATLFATAQMRVRAFERQLNEPIVAERIDLSPVSDARGGEVNPRTVSPDGDVYRFVMGLSGRMHYPNYRVSIHRRNDDRELWNTTRAQREEDDTFEIIVRKSVLSSGEYEIHITGLDGTESELLNKYAFRIR